MLFSKVKDLKIRKDFKRIEKKILIKKFLFINFLTKLSFQHKINRASFVLHLLKRKSFNRSKTKIVRRCAIVNRSRAIIRPYNISRIVLRNLLHLGLIPGCTKAVW